MNKIIQIFLILILIHTIAFPPYNLEGTYTDEYENAEKVINLNFYAPIQHRLIPYFLFYHTVKGFLVIPFMTIKRASMLAWGIINFISISIGMHFLLKLFNKKNRLYVLLFSLLIMAWASKSPSFLRVHETTTFAFLTLSFFLIRQNKYKILWILIPIATLFKEVSLLIPIFYFCYQKMERNKTWKPILIRTIPLLFIWVIAYLSIRLSIPVPIPPSRAYAISLGFTYITIASFLDLFRFYDLIVFGLPVLILLAISLKFPLERFQTHYRLLVLFHLSLILLVGSAKETRQFLPILPFLIPNVDWWVVK